MLNDSIDNLRLDLNRSKVQQSISVRAGDTKTRTIHVSIANNGNLYKLDNTLFAELLIKKADGNECDQNMVISGNELHYTFRTQDVSAIGENTCQVKLTGKDGSIITTPEFRLYVYTQVVDQFKQESMNEYTAITTQVTMAYQYAESAKTYQNNAKTYSDTAQTAAESAESAVSTVEEYKDSAEEAAESAEEFATAAEVYASQADATKSDIEDIANTVAGYVSAVSADKETVSGYVTTAQSAVTSAQSYASAAAESAEEADGHAEEIQGYLTSAQEEATKAKGYADSASDSATEAGSYNTAMQGYLLQAQSAVTSAEAEVTKAKAEVTKANTSATNAALSESMALSYATVAEAAEANAKSYKETAETESSNASGYATAAFGYKNSAESAKTDAQTYASNASDYADDAEDSATSAQTYANLSKSYAVGTDNVVRDNDKTENAKSYYEKAKQVVEGAGGGFVPYGTIDFSELPALADTATGAMYNIADVFLSDSRFKDGSGLFYPAGTNVYKTSDGYWDCMAGSTTTMDSSLNTVTFTEASTRSNISNNETHATLFGKIKKFFADLKTVAFTGSYSDLTDKPTIPTVPTDISAFTNDSGYITGYTETDPTVPAWAKEANKPTYTASEVGALPDTTVIPTVPTNVSAFTNDSNYQTKQTTLAGYGIIDAKIANGVITLGSNTITPITQHQSISGKADKASITAGTAGTSSATSSGLSLAVPYVTVTAQGIVSGYGTHTHTICTEVSGTLAANATSLTLSNAAINTSSTIEVFTSVYGVNPKTVTVNNGSVVLTFAARSSSMSVKIRVS